MSQHRHEPPGEPMPELPSERVAGPVAHRHDRRDAHHGGHGHGRRGRAADAALIALCRTLTPGRALDLGAGYGRNSLWLARHGWRVVALDRAPEPLARLAEDAAAAGASVTTEVADIDAYLGDGSLSEPPSFDLVVMANLHPAPPVLRRWLQLAARAVPPGGHLFVAGHHLASLGVAGPPDPDRLYTEERLEGAFPGLRMLHMERHPHPHGPAAAVDLVAWAVRPATPGEP